MKERIVYAKLKNFSQKPRKVRLCVGVVRGKGIDDAVAILKNLDKKGATAVLKVLNSAVANAVSNSGMDKSRLYVKEARVDAGMTRKKPYYRAKGGMDLIRRQYSHILIGVAEKSEDK